MATSLYPGQSVTGLCPVDTFDDTPIYARGDVPDDAEVAARRDAVWVPYHAQLRAELDRIRAQHGVAVLWDAHSIRSVLPRFFEGKLTDLNLGTANGESCDPALAQDTAVHRAKSAPGLHRQCSTVASRAGTSRATMGSPRRTSTRCSWR